MKLRRPRLPFEAALLFSLVFTSVLSADPQPPALRLPAGVAPARYAAELWIDPAKDAFRGRIEIEISSKEEMGAVWLNAKELDVQAVSARPAGGGAAIPGAAAKGGSDYVRLTFQRNLSPGSWFLSLEYTGRVASKDTEGVFHQKDGSDWYAYTQFEAIYARRAFPCFDEPSFKTPWQLTLHVPEGSIAVSNTPVASETADPDGGRRFAFAPTRPLPSYLVAFGVGPFDVVNAGTAGRNRTPIRMIVPKGHAADARWAAESTGPILDVLESYFGIPYPYEKLDNLAIPQTVGFGAMENAGLVTYASSLMLAKPADETISERRRWASVCAHEMAHQWFGDLRDDRVVGRHLAQRGVRDVDGLEDRRPVEARVELGRAARGRADDGDGRGLARRPPGGSGSRSRETTTSRTRSTASPTRRAPRSSGCSRAGSARRASGRGSGDI